MSDTTKPPRVIRNYTLVWKDGKQEDVKAHQVCLTTTDPFGFNGKKEVAVAFRAIVDDSWQAVFLAPLDLVHHIRDNTCLDVLEKMCQAGPGGKHP